MRAGVVLVVLLTAVVYIPVLRGGFVFDDTALITRNQLVQAADGLYRFWFTAEAPDYRPLTWSLWWLEWRLWDGRATGYHVVNIVLHAVNAVLVWIILRRLKIPGAWLTAAVFAIHPVNVATVAWISEQKNTLSMLLYALAVLLYLRFDEEGRWRWYTLSLTAGLLAVLSKTAVVMLPVVLLGCVWWRHGKLRAKDWLCSLPFFLPSLVLGLVTIIQHQRTLGGAVRAGGFAGRLATAGWVPWFYLSKALWPVDLMMIYPRWEADACRWISFVPGVMWLGFFLAFLWKRQSWGRPVLFGLGYFVVMLFPVWGFFDQAFYRFSLVADHWQYHSIVGVIALMVAAVTAICRRLGEQSRHAGTLAGVIVLMMLGVITWRRGRVYTNEETLWRDNVAKNPNAWAAQNNLALTLWQSGKVQEAIEHYEHALQLSPNYAEAHHNLGLALLQANKPQDAIQHFEQVVRIKPGSAEAHRRLGLALRQAGKLQEATAQFDQALRMKPDSPETHTNLGNASLQAGKFRDALGHYEQALQINPDYAEARNNLAWLLAALPPADGGDPARAVTLARRACASTHDHVAAYLDTLGAAYAAAGRFNDAIAAAQQASELARSDGQPQLARQIEARLQMYRSGRAYHQAADMSRP